jgi:hypothetical protein
MPITTQVGQTLFTALAFMEMIVICTITPAITAGAISGEKERQTYEMLLATPLHPMRILLGKLISALSYIFLLIFAALPLASLIFTFGGVTIRDIIKALIVLISVALLVGSISIFFSSLTSRTGRAMVLSYVTLMGMLFIPPILSTVVTLFRQSGPPRWLLVPSPFSALFSALASLFNSSGSYGFGLLGFGFWGAVQPGWSTESIPRPIYHYSIPLFALLSVILCLIAARFVMPTRRGQVKWKDTILISIGLIVIIAGITAAGFLLTADRYENITSTQDLVPRPVMAPGVVEEVVIEAVPVMQDEVPTPTPMDPPAVDEKGGG